MGSYILSPNKSIFVLSHFLYDGPKSINLIYFNHMETYVMLLKSYLVSLVQQWQTHGLFPPDEAESDKIKWKLWKL